MLQEHEDLRAQGFQFISDLTYADLWHLDKWAIALSLTGTVNIRSSTALAADGYLLWNANIPTAEDLISLRGRRIS